MQLLRTFLHDACRGRLSLIHQSRQAILLEVGGTSLMSHMEKERGFSDASLSPNGEDIVAGFLGLENLLCKKQEFLGATNKDCASRWGKKSALGRVFLDERH